MISDKTAQKLGFNTLIGWLKERLVSPMGAEQLHALRPAADSVARTAALTHTEALQGHLLRGDTLPLQDLVDVRAYLEQARPDGAMLNAESLDEVRKVCRASRRMRTFFSRKGDPILSRFVRSIVILQEELEHPIAHTVDANRRIKDSASTELRQIRRRLRQRQQALREKLRELLAQAVQKGYAAENQLTMRAGRMVIPLRAEAKRKMRGFVHDSSASGQTVYLEPASCLDLGNEVRILEAQEQREIERLLRALTQRVSEQAGAIEHNLRVLGKMDLLHAKAQLSIRLGGVIPVLSEEPVLKIREGKNPALLLTGKSREIIPLTISLGSEIRTLVITGPNAGGKTVAMKTCGLMLAMLGCGIPVPVHPESVFGTFHQILVEIGDEQSIEQDLSTFSARVSGLRRMCDAADEGVLLLVDEIGTGTDPAEGAALAQAVLEQFTASGALTVVTTHHGTLKAYAHEAAGVANGSMDFDEDTLRPTFLFRQGLPGSSYAFRIARRMKFPPAVLARARQILGKPGLSLEALITSYRNRIAKLEASRKSPKRMPPDAPAHSVPDPAVRRMPGKVEPLPAVKLDVGQQVLIDGGKNPCEILSIQGHNALVSAGNMRMKVPLKRLKSIQRTKLRKKGTLNVSTPRTRIDLRGFRIHEALSEVEKLLDQAASANLSSVEIIHGTGTGALRNAIHRYLKTSEVNKTFECLDANPGVTIVKI